MKWTYALEVTEQAWDYCPKKACFARLPLSWSLGIQQVNSSLQWYKAFPKDPHLGKWSHHGTQTLHNPEPPHMEAQLVSDKLSLIFKPSEVGFYCFQSVWIATCVGLYKTDSEIISQSPVYVS